MKAKEELNALGNEIETLNEKKTELTADALDQVTGGTDEESTEEILRRQEEKVRRALEGLLNPPLAYKTTGPLTPKQPPLPEIDG